MRCHNKSFHEVIIMNGSLGEMYLGPWLCVLWKLPWDMYILWSLSAWTSVQSVKKFLLGHFLDSLGFTDEQYRFWSETLHGLHVLNLVLLILNATPLCYKGQSESSYNGLITFLSTILWSRNFTLWGFYTSQVKLHQKHHTDIMSFVRSWNVMAVVSVEEQRSYIKVEYLRGKLGKKIHENLCEACGNNALSFKTA